MCLKFKVRNLFEIAFGGIHECDLSCGGRSAETQSGGEGLVKIGDNIPEQSNMRRQPLDSLHSPRHHDSDMRECFIGYDLGTSGMKTAIIDAEGKLLASDSASYQYSSPKPTWHEQNPDEWWQAIIRTTRNVIRLSGVTSFHVVGISLGVQGLGFIPVDSSGHHLRPCMTWLDARGEKQARQITDETGVKVSPKTVVSKALWLSEHEPRIFERAYRFMDCGAYLIARLTGNFAWSKENASWYGYDVRNGNWNFGRYGLSPERLPDVKRSTAIVGETSRHSGEQLGLRAGIPVAAGGGDVSASYVGAGAIKVGSAHLYLGSSSWVCSSDMQPAELSGTGLDFLSLRPFDNWLNVGESESAGSCLDWFLYTILGARKRQTVRELYAQANDMAGNVPPGSGNLIFLPWMKGERAPVADECARGSLIGLTLSHRKEHIIRAVMEGVALNTRWIIEELESLGTTEGIGSLRAIGGGFLNPVWRQIFSDVLGREIDVLRNPQYAGSIGAGLIAAVGTGTYKSVQELHELLPVMRRLHPRKNSKAIYSHVFADFKRSFSKEMGNLYRSWGPV